jgi:hypothetical protein
MLDWARYLQSGAGFGSHTLAGSAFTFLTLPWLVPQGNTQFRSHYFAAEFFPQDWSHFLKFPLVWKRFEDFFTVMCECLQWCPDTSHTTLKLVAPQIPSQWKLHRIYVKRDLTKRSRPLIGGTLGGIEHLPLYKKRSVFSFHIQVIIFVLLHVIDLRFNVLTSIYALRTNWMMREREFYNKRLIYFE